MPVPLLPDLRFDAPVFLLLVPVAILLALLGARRGAGTAVEFGALRLFGQTGKLARGGLGAFAAPLFPLAILAGAIALARPQRIDESELTTGEGIEIIVAIDVSFSMSIEDYQLDGRRVNRLDASKSVIKEFIDGRPNDRIGLVIFSGNAHNLGALTMNHDWLLDTIDREVQFRRDIKGGTAIGSAIGFPARKLADREAKSKVVVLITDGAHEGDGLQPTEAAALAATLGIKVYPIAIGTPGRHFAPLVRDWLDQRFDLETLKEVAKITKAKAFEGKDTAALRKVFKEIDALEKSEVERRTIINTKEYFQWPAAAAALFALLGLLWEFGPGRVAPD
jgi:Ca-activated chloride channel family protein